MQDWKKKQEMTVRANQVMAHGTCCRVRFLPVLITDLENTKLVSL